jgi:hypothetical protein
MVMGWSSFEPVSKATEAAMFTTVPRPRLLPAVSKIFREGAFSDHLGVRNESSLEPAGPSFFGRIFDASVRRNKPGRYHQRGLELSD